jgi:hypothetical protein
MSTFKRLSDTLGISQSISYLISNTQSGIDSIGEVYDALYTLNTNNSSKISNLESQLIGLSYSFNGLSGTSGISGTSGVNGATGSNGLNGTSGISGTSGVNGSQGNKGGLQYTLENYGGGTPATGKFTFNASEGTAFDLRINITDRLSANNSGYFSQLLGSSGYIYITNNSNSISRAIVYPFTNVTLVSGYYLFGLDFNEGIDGTVLPPNDICALTIVINGRTVSGSSGTSGVNGATGPAGSNFIPVLSPMETFRGQTHRNNSTTIDTYGGVVTSTSASNLAQSVGTASFVSRHIRLRYYASIVSTGRYTGVRGSSQQFWSVTGGFRYVCDFNISDTAYSSSTQQFYGLGAYNTDLNYGGSSTLLVSSLTNNIGIGNDSGDANLQVIYNDGSGSASKLDLGPNFPANRTSGLSQTTIYSVQLYNYPGSSSVLYEVTNQETGSVVNGTLTTNLPSSNLLLNFFASRAMGSGGGITNSGQFDLMKLGVYSLL